jgi:tetratricopeptide (TPR) repeat protein
MYFLKRLPKGFKVLLLIAIALLLSLYLFLHNAGALFSTGNFFFGGRFYDLNKAMFFYDLALKQNPSQSGVHYQMGRIYFLNADFNRAIEEINKEIALYPDFKRSYYIRGLVYGYQKDFKKAEADFLTFLAWKPDSWAGHNDLSWVYFQEGDFVNAAKYAKEGLVQNPDNPWLLNSLGIALLNQKKYKEAEEALSRGLSIFKTLPPEVWGRAYPGNNSQIYEEGYGATLKVLERNLELAQKAQL